LWQWFLDNGIYIIIALSIGIVLVFLTTLLSRAIVRRIVPKNLTEGLKNTRRILTGVIAIALGVPIVFLIISFIISRFGVDVTPALKAVGNWFMEHGIIILVIIIGAFIVNKVIILLLPSIIRRLVKVRGEGRSAQEEIEKRSGTLSRFLTSVSTVIIVIMSLIMVLSEIGVDIAPLLVGAGFVGIAVGFGGQKLVSDILNGLFIVTEDYYSAGDVIRVAGIAGLVEDVNIRRTILRDLDGIVHIIPNGQIETASNFTKNWSRVNLNIPVAYGEDLDKVIDILNRVGKEIAEDSYFGPLIIKAPQVLRVDNFGDSGIEIKILGETQPIKQWEVTGELRKRIKKAFDDEGIEIPWPHTKVYFGNAPWENESKDSSTRAKSKKYDKRPPEAPHDNRDPLPPDSLDD
jgi:small conductance mechanosensitive channel